MIEYKLKCEILSPVHIGSGQELDPLNYIIDGGKLYKVSLLKFVASMNDAERIRFENIITTGNLIEIRKYVGENIDKEKDSSYSLQVSPAIESLYRSKLNDIQNQLLIQPFIKTEGGHSAFMPGSSIKGALRTAIVSEIAKKINPQKPKGNKEENRFESKVLSYKDGKDDPFRGLRIRDKCLKEEDLIVREVRNVSKGKGKNLQTNKMQIICEVSHSSITGKQIEFDTVIFFDDKLFATKYLSNNFNIEKIIKSCRDFYKEKMEYEHGKFYKKSEVETFSAHLLDTPLDEKSFIIRLGRFSGVESVTLDNYRNPRPPGKKRIWGTSRNIAEGLYPMGWVKITVSN